MISRVSADNFLSELLSGNHHHLFGMTWTLAGKDTIFNSNCQWCFFFELYFWKG
jgi:hypothetical protein